MAVAAEGEDADHRWEEVVWVEVYQLCVADRVGQGGHREVDTRAEDEGDTVS
jgi:hypothetical protein